MSKAILFINGDPPQPLPNTEGYFVMCTDGAYNYLKDNDLRIDALIGDLDSVADQKENIKVNEIIEAYNQDYTDFQKALHYLSTHGYLQVEVYGAVGKEQDHFLGNLTAAVQFKKKLHITFHAVNYRFWLCKPIEKIKTEVGSTVSLYPFPKATQIKTKGLQYPLNKEKLSLSKRIGIRNHAIDKEVYIRFKKGNLWVFVYNDGMEKAN